MPDVADVADFVDVSQHGEASILATLVDPSWPRYLVDVGAHDGRSLSNSFPFLELGWSGVLVEPLPSAFELLTSRYADRPDVRCVQAACGARAERMLLSLGDDGPVPMTSSLRGGGKRRVEVNVDTVTNVLDQAHAPTDFSFLLIDAERMDTAVLEGLDLDRYRPRVVVTEDDPSDRAAHFAKERLLVDHGYVLYTVVAGANSIWLSADHANAAGELPLSSDDALARVDSRVLARRCAYLEHSRDEIWRQLVVLQSSRSWQLTRPLRRMASRLRLLRRRG